MRPPSPVTACLVLALFVTCSHAAWRPHAGWSSDRVKNIIVYTDTYIEHRWVEDWLELSYAAFQSSFFRHLAPEPVEVLYLQREPGALLRFFGPNDNPAQAWALQSLPDKTRIGSRGLIILKNRNQWLASLQLAHHFIHRALPAAPLWLQVGFARYLATFRVHYHPGATSNWLVCFGAASPPFGPVSLRIDIEDVLAASWDDYNQLGHGRGWYEGAAFAFVYYLIHSTASEQLRPFMALLRAIARGGNAQAALVAAYPALRPGQADGVLRQYVANAPLWYLPRTLPQGLCKWIPPANYHGDAPRRRAAAETDIAKIFAQIDRLPLFTAYAGVYPTEVVEEVAKRDAPASVPRAGGRGEVPVAPRAIIQLKDRDSP